MCFFTLDFVKKDKNSKYKLIGYTRIYRVYFMVTLGYNRLYYLKNFYLESHNTAKDDFSKYRNCIRIKC